MTPKVKIIIGNTTFKIFHNLEKNKIFEKFEKQP